MAASNRTEILEDEAEGEVRAIYEDIRLVLRVGMVPFLWRQVALHPAFLRVAWEQSRPNLRSRYLAVRSEELCALALDWADMPRVESLWHGRLEKIGPVAEIRNIVRGFFHLIPGMLITAAGLEESLALGPIGGLGILAEVVDPPPVEAAADMRVPRLEELSGEMRALLRELQEVHTWHGLPSVFRSLARFPQYLEVAWTEVIRPLVQTPGYRLRASQLYSLAFQMAHCQPYRVDVGRRRVEELGLAEGQIEDIRVKLALFHRFLSEVILDIGVLHASPGGL